MLPYDKLNKFGQSKYVTDEPMIISRLTYEEFECDVAKTFVEQVNKDNKLNLRIEKDFNPPFCNILVTRTEKSPGVLKQNIKK